MFVLFLFSIKFRFVMSLADMSDSSSCEDLHEYATLRAPPDERGVQGLYWAVTYCPADLGTATDGCKGCRGKGRLLSIEAGQGLDRLAKGKGKDKGKGKPDSSGKGKPDSSGKGRSRSPVPDWIAALPTDSAPVASQQDTEYALELQT